LAGLRGLRSLSIRENRVDDLSALADLEKMNWLEFDQNRVTDLGPLAGLAALRRVYMENNRVTVLMPLSKLAALEELQGLGNEVPREQISLLERALPKCKIRAGVFSKIPTRRDRQPGSPEKK
jgi:Leucine-rich repeat (LRR) protein